MEDKKPLNKIIRDNTGKKKFKVYVKDNSTGNIKTVRFGDPNLSIKRDQKSNTNMALTDRQKKTLKKHSVHHSKKHMAIMNALMNKGKSFKIAHREALKIAGK